MIQSAVIGAGQVARQHLACVSGLPGVRLAGVCDLSRAMAEAAAERHRIPAWFTDHQKMLAEIKPDIVHITTPPSSHFRLAQDCLNAGAHVFVEKPATARFEELTALQALASSKGRWLIEDYNYLYNEPVRRVRLNAAKGALGQIIHVDVTMCLNILDKDNPFSDPNLRHPALDLEGGAITDFLPHLASLAYFFCGKAHKVKTLWEKRSEKSPLPYDEFRAVVQAERSSASFLFSAHAQPDVFRLSVHGTQGRAVADIYENRLTQDLLRSGPRPLIPFFNALDNAKITRRSAWKLLWQKLGNGPGAYEGLWTLTRRVYEAIETQGAPPFSADETLEINRLVDELKKQGNRF